MGLSIPFPIHAPRGTGVAFFVTGQGLVNPTVAGGVQPTGYQAPVLPVSVSLVGSHFLLPTWRLTA